MRFVTLYIINFGSILPESFYMSRGDVKNFWYYLGSHCLWVRLSGTIAQIMPIESHGVICIKIYFLFVVVGRGTDVGPFSISCFVVQADWAIDKRVRYLFDRLCRKVYMLSIALLPVLPCDNNLGPKLVLAYGSH